MKTQNCEPISYMYTTSQNSFSIVFSFPVLSSFPMMVIFLMFIICFRFIIALSIISSFSGVCQAFTRIVSNNSHHNHQCIACCLRLGSQTSLSLKMTGNHLQRLVFDVMAKSLVFRYFQYLLIAAKAAQQPPDST